MFWTSAMTRSPEAVAVAAPLVARVKRSRTGSPAAGETGLPCAATAVGGRPASAARAPAEAACRTVLRAIRMPTTRLTHR